MLMALAFLLTLAGAALLARRASRRAAAARAAEEVRVEREAARRTWLRVDPDIGAAIRPARRAGAASRPARPAQHRNRRHGLHDPAGGAAVA